MQSGTLSGSLMPPRRKPRETCAFRFTSSRQLVAGDHARRDAVASVVPGCDTSDVPVLSLAKMPSKTAPCPR